LRAVMLGIKHVNVIASALVIGVVFMVLQEHKTIRGGDFFSPIF